MEVREFMTEFQNSGNFVVLNSFQPMQVENPNFELFWELCPKNFLNGLRLIKKLNFGTEKLGNFILSGK